MHRFLWRVHLGRKTGSLFERVLEVDPTWWNTEAIITVTSAFTLHMVNSSLLVDVTKAFRIFQKVRGRLSRMLNSRVPSTFGVICFCIYHPRLSPKAVFASTETSLTNSSPQKVSRVPYRFGSWLWTASSQLVISTAIRFIHKYTHNTGLVLNISTVTHQIIIHLL